MNESIGKQLRYVVAANMFKLLLKKKTLKLWQIKNIIFYTLFHNIHRELREKKYID